MSLPDHAMWDTPEPSFYDEQREHERRLDDACENGDGIERCWCCRGTGWEPCSERDIACSTCLGTGQVTTDDADEHRATLSLPLPFAEAAE